MEPKVIDIEQDFEEDYYLPEKPTKDDKYFIDISKVMNLLSACVIVPNGEGTAELSYLIKDKDNRQELENYAMNLTRKNLHAIIKVNEEGLKLKKRKV